MRTTEQIIAEVCETRRKLGEVDLFIEQIPAAGRNSPLAREFSAIRGGLAAKLKALRTELIEAAEHELQRVRAEKAEGVAK